MFKAARQPYMHLIKGSIPRDLKFIIDCREGFKTGECENKPVPSKIKKNWVHLVLLSLTESKTGQVMAVIARIPLNLDDLPGLSLSWGELNLHYF